MPRDEETTKCQLVFRRHVENYAKTAADELDALDIGGILLAVGMTVLSQRLGPNGAIKYVRELADKAALAATTSQTMN
ncbi:MAG: hypothetical protein ABUS47_16205 [Steroidobacter sp.]